MVEPLQRSDPLLREGFNKLLASIDPPLVAPAPITVCISSINKTDFLSFCKSFRTSFNLSSKEFNGRYFHNIDAWRIENLSAGSVENEIQDAPEFNAPATEEDDLPF